MNEALAKYYRAKTGHSTGILPPDIFLGLRFNDMNKDQSVDPNAGSEVIKILILIHVVNSDYIITSKVRLLSAKMYLTVDVLID